MVDIEVVAQADTHDDLADDHHDARDDEEEAPPDMVNPNDGHQSRHHIDYMEICMSRD